MVRDEAIKLRSKVLEGVKKMLRRKNKKAEVTSSMIKRIVGPSIYSVRHQGDREKQRRLKAYPSLNLAMRGH